MNRTEAVRTAALIALPFFVLPVSIWLGATAAAQLPVLDWWWVVRWTLRAVYIGGPILGWRAGRPRWFYPWLGFAVYEAVATLLWLAVYATGVIQMDRDFEDIAFYLFFVFIALAFVPYFAAVVWVGWPRRRRSLFFSGTCRNLVREVPVGGRARPCFLVACLLANSSFC